MNEEELNLELTERIAAVRATIAAILAPGYVIDDKNQDRIRELAQFAPE